LKFYYGRKIGVYIKKQAPHLHEVHCLLLTDL
jgi:hypothetical protein